MVAPVMKAGFYNGNSQLQHNAIVNALSVVTAAVADVPIPTDGPLQITDMGCSQGLNSMLPLKYVMATLASRLDHTLDIRVTHEDLPQNDFSSVFRVISDPQVSYLPPHQLDIPKTDSSTDVDSSVAADQQALSKLQVYPSVVGRSFYERLFPQNSVHLALAFTCLHWIDNKPAKPSDTYLGYKTKDSTVRDAFKKEFARSFCQFLGHRTIEGVQGCRLVLSMLTYEDGDQREPLKTVEDAIMGMVADGKLTAADVGEMSAKIYMPTPAFFLEVVDQFSGQWAVEYSRVEFVHVGWDIKYQQGEISAEELGTQMSNMWRAVFEPTFLAGLRVNHSEVEAAELTSELWSRVEAVAARDAVQNGDQGYNYLYVSLVRI